MIFRYPGGKGKLMKHFLNDIPTTGYCFAEPFVGGGSVALAIAQRDIKKSILINDFDPWVSHFWQIITGSNQDLFNNLIKLVSHKPTIEQFNERRQKFFPEDVTKRNIAEPLDAAFNAIFFNRTTFSGMFGSGPIGAYEQRGEYLIGCRFNPPRLQKEIKHAREVLAGRTTVTCLDFEEFLKSVPKDCFLYLDPPYYKQGESLYGASLGNGGHDRLRSVLDERLYWLLSYDNCPEIREKYKGFRIQVLNKFRSMSSSRDEFDETIRPNGDSELLIFSKEIPMPESIKRKGRNDPKCKTCFRAFRKGVDGICAKCIEPPLLSHSAFPVSKSFFSFLTAEDFTEAHKTGFFKVPWEIAEKLKY
jgi:DNA adenine methylase